MYPKLLVFSIWGGFEGENVSQIARFLDLGCIFASDCIPKVLFWKFGVFLRRQMYPKWLVFLIWECIFASYCIPKVLFWRFGVFLRLEIFFTASVSQAAIFIAFEIFIPSSRISNRPVFGVLWYSVLLVSQIPKKSDFYDTNGVLKYRECLEYSRFMIRTREKIS